MAFFKTLKVVLVASILTFIFSGGFLLNLLFLLNNIYINTVLVSLLVYQYGFNRRRDWARNLFFNLGFDDFLPDHTVIKEEELKREKFILCLLPHGLFGVGTFATMFKERIFYDSRWMVSAFVKLTPLSGIIGGLIGFEGISPEAFKDALKKGDSIAFMPGGFEEATLTDNNQNNLYLQQRKGFIKYAIQFGYPLYFTYTFGENKLVPVITWFKSFRLFLNKLKIPGVIALPYFNINQKLVTVVSKRIVLPHDPNPSDKMVEQHHKFFLEEVTKLYNKHRNVTEGNTDLVIE